MPKRKIQLRKLACYRADETPFSDYQDIRDGDRLNYILHICILHDKTGRMLCPKTMKEKIVYCFKFKDFKHLCVLMKWREMGIYDSLF